MGKLGKETKNLLLAITVICLISFLLAAGLSFLLAKDFQHEMLLHDYGVSGYQLNHEDKLQISAFTAHPNESDIERGKEALASIGYSEATSMQLLPTVREYRNQTMLYLFLLLLCLFGIRGYEVGAVDYITKPFVIGALQRKIKAMFAMLEHHRPAKDIYDDGGCFWTSRSRRLS